jgi:hypothetical protein
MRNFIFLIVLTLCLLACSPSQIISDAASRTSQKAGNIVTTLDEALNTGEVGPKAEPLVKDAQADARCIQAEAQKIIRQIPKIEDKTPLWAQVLMWVAGAFAAIAVCFVLWHLGIGYIVAPILKIGGGTISALAALIPTSTRSAAKFDAEAIINGHASTEQDKVITLRRTSDPLYDAAYVIEANKLKKRAEQPPTSAT